MRSDNGPGSRFHHKFERGRESESCIVRDLLLLILGTLKSTRIKTFSLQINLSTLRIAMDHSRTGPVVSLHGIKDPAVSPVSASVMISVCFPIYLMQKANQVEPCGWENHSLSYHETTFSHLFRSPGGGPIHDGGVAGFRLK